MLDPHVRTMGLLVAPFVNLGAQNHHCLAQVANTSNDVGSYVIMYFSCSSQSLCSQMLWSWRMF